MCFPNFPFPFFSLFSVCSFLSTSCNCTNFPFPFFSLFSVCSFPERIVSALLSHTFHLLSLIYFPILLSQKREKKGKGKRGGTTGSAGNEHTQKREKKGKGKFLWESWATNAGWRTRRHLLYLPNGIKTPPHARTPTMSCKKCKHPPATAGLFSSLAKLLFKRGASAVAKRGASAVAKRGGKAAIKAAARKAAGNAVKNAAASAALKQLTQRKKRKPTSGARRTRPAGVGRAGSARTRPTGVGRAGARLLRDDQRVV